MGLNSIAAKSDLMNIDITYNGKRYRFNLYQELQVKEHRVNDDVKSHPSSYAFLTQLRSYVQLELDILEAAKERMYNKYYKSYKNAASKITHRVFSDDMANAKALTNKDYKKAVSKYLKMKFQKSVLDNAIKAFETRGFLLQTLSANLRNER